MVIDTGIFIEYLRAKDKQKTTLYSIPDDSELFISAVSVYELYVGINASNQEANLRELLTGITILPFTDDVAMKAAKLFRDLKRKNKVIEFRDIFIAATCIVNREPLLTLNRKHFERIDVLPLV